MQVGVGGQGSGLLVSAAPSKLQMLPDPAHLCHPCWSHVFFAEVSGNTNVSGGPHGEGWFALVSPS